MKEFELKMTERSDEYEGVTSQKVWSDNPEEKVCFRVCNLCECPEDAIIGRDLFDANDFIRAVELGFRIAKRGYDKITVTNVPYEYD
jgi:hypothetical protein